MHRVILRLGKLRQGQAKTRRGASCTSRAAALLHACPWRKRGSHSRAAALARASSGAGSGSGTPARSGDIASIPAPEPPSCPPAGRCAPAAFRPPLVFLAGGSHTHRAQQFPARVNTFLSPIAGPSNRLPTLVLDAAARAVSPISPPTPSAITSPGWEMEQSLGMRDAEVCVTLLRFWGAKGGDV